MIFKRSQSSLNSMHLFFKVDVVVFCEGGASKTIVEALMPAPDERTLDTIYWANVVSVQDLGRRYHFKSVGSKVTLLKIAREIVAVNSSTATVCIDSDYDVHLSQMVPSSRLAHTFGYSWESDVLQRPVLDKILAHLIGPPPTELTTDIERAIVALRRDALRWCEIDISLRAKAKPCVFDREKPLSVVNLAAELPCLDHARLRRRLTESGYKRAPKRVVTLQEEVVLQVAFGKLISKLLYHLIHKLALTVVHRLRLDYESFMRVAISETFSLFRTGQLPDFAAHITRQRAAFA